MDADLPNRLKQIPELSEVPDKQIQWLLDNATCLSLKEGEFLFRKGDPIDTMSIILSGSFSIKVEQNGNYRFVSKIEKNSITGNLPYSRATTATGFAEANESSEVVVLHKSKFKEMIHKCDELTTALVHVMSTRIREFTKLQQQNDKMMALGKLSAGLSHELNNPSAAVVRSARSLKKHLSFLPDHFKNVIKIRIDDDAVDAVNKIVFDKAQQGEVTLPLSERSDREDDIAEWLEVNGFDDGYEIAEGFVDFNFSVEELEKVKNLVSKKDLIPILNWLNQVLTTEKLVNEIEDASQRINDLVLSVKSYTHMDQAPEKQPMDIHKGIKNTLTMLKHKVNKNNIEVVTQFADLPEVSLFVSEMNQVWTNLIDNAIDAMDNGNQRVLTVETLKDGEFVNVNISDSGKGIPEDIQGQIFDPFFTTKPIGQGTGLGLDVVKQIVNQHNGSIKVKSKPGETTFMVCVPIK